MLHEYARRRQTAILIGGVSTTPEQLEHTLHELKPLADGHIVETVVAIAANEGIPDVEAYLEPAMAEKLGVGDITLLVVRADGHVGLHAESSHAKALAAYKALLQSGRATKTRDQKLAECSGPARARCLVAAPPGR